MGAHVGKADNIGAALDPENKTKRDEGNAMVGAPRSSLRSGGGSVHYRYWFSVHNRNARLTTTEPPTKYP